MSELDVIEEQAEKELFELIKKINTKESEQLQNRFVCVEVF